MSQGPSANFAAAWVRKLSDATSWNYIRHIVQFAKFPGRSPDTATADDTSRCIWPRTAHDVDARTNRQFAARLRSSRRRLDSMMRLALLAIRCRNARRASSLPAVPLASSLKSSANCSLTPYVLVTSIGCVARPKPRSNGLSFSRFSSSVMHLPARAWTG